jgi:hypothetical protein
LKYQQAQIATAPPRAVVSLSNVPLLSYPPNMHICVTICRDNFDVLPLLQGHGAGPSGLAPALQNDRQPGNLVHFICLVCIPAFDRVMLIVYLSGPEEARTSGWSSMDRRRAPLPITSVGTLSKQKAPVGNDAIVSRDAVVSCHVVLCL